MGSGQPWVPHGDLGTTGLKMANIMPTMGTPRWLSSLLKLHGLTGARLITATGATDCGICRGWVTTFGWFHHLGN